MKNFYSIYQKFAGFLSGFKLGEIPFLRQLHGFLKVHLRPKFVKIGEYKFFINRNDFAVSSHLLGDKVYEPTETNIVRGQINKGDIVVDMGANIGYYTLIFAGLVGKSGKVFAFEPDRDNFALLSKNVKENKFDNVILINKAISDKNGQTKLYLSKDNKGDHRIYDSGENRDSVVVDVVCLDDFLGEYKHKINFIKMDIQGAEGNALKGMIDIIKNSKKIKILAEFWPMGLSNFNFNPKEFLEILEDYGFSFYNIQRAGTIKATKDEILKKYPADKIDHTNLFCIKN
ncbi:MAG: FkbM family methyltransferase [Candidatus Portnoybacteria bacterium]|nr:FkbM family methyltransferase [Candidatus Portnoybacteria bacterium]MDD5752072.1 FkbM family methyltransferase [Candidatus Portnoybacteria bacterium]